MVSLQGDLLVWLLSAAFAHDSTHSQAVLAHARARDELLMATMELRERAMALHLHIPRKFTLNTRRERVDVRASWAAVICKVEQVRGLGLGYDTATCLHASSTASLASVIMTAYNLSLRNCVVGHVHFAHAPHSPVICPCAAGA